MQETQKQENLLYSRLSQAYELIKNKSGKINEQDYQILKPMFRQIPQLKQIPINARLEVEENKSLFTVQEKVPDIYICIDGELQIDADMKEAKAVFKRLKLLLKQKSQKRQSMVMNKSQIKQQDSYGNKKQQQSGNGAVPGNGQGGNKQQQQQAENQDQEKNILPAAIFGGLYALTGKKWRPSYVIAIKQSLLIKIDIQKTKALLDVCRELSKYFDQKINSSQQFQQLLQFLSFTIPGFSRLSAVYRQRIARCFKQRRFIQGQHLITEGTPIQYAYIIRQGDCKIYSDRNPLQYSKKQMSARNKRAQSSNAASSTKSLLQNNRGYMSRTTNTLTLGLIGPYTWVADDLFILRDHLKILSTMNNNNANNNNSNNNTATNNNDAFKINNAMTSNGMLQGSIKDDDLIAQYSVIAVSVQVTALQIAKDELSKIPKEFAQILKRGAQQRNLWIEQRKHKLAQNSSRVSNLDPLNQVYDDAFKQIARRHPRATVSTLAKLRDKQIQIATCATPGPTVGSPSPTGSPLRNVTSSRSIMAQTNNSMWPGNLNNNTTIRKSFPNLINSTELFPPASPMATITDIEMDPQYHGIASKSALKNFSNINTLSSGRISVHARSQTNMPAPQLKSVAMIGGGYFNTQLQTSVNGPNKNFTTPLQKQQHLPYGGVGSINQAQNNSLFNPNLYFDPHRQLMSRGSITSGKQNNNPQMPQLQQQPSINNMSRPQSQMQLQNSMMNPVSIISGNDNIGYHYHNSQNNLNSNQFTSRTSGNALGMSASAQQLRAAFSNTILSQKQQAIGDTLMLQVLSSMNNYNSQPQFRTLGSSPQTSKQSRVLMQNAATFKTSIESKYLLPTYNKLIKTDRITGKTKISNSNLQSILVSTNSKRRMESALKMERQANMKHIGFKIGRFKNVKTINNNNDYEFSTRKTLESRDSFNHQPDVMSFQKKRPPSPNPAEQWARSKGFKLQDYSKIKKAFHSKVDSHKQSRPRDSMVDFIGTMQLQRMNIKEVLF